MNGSPSVKVALFIRNGGSESPCRWFYVTGIYNVSIPAPIEPPVRSLRATIPAAQSHPSGGVNHHSGK